MRVTSMQVTQEQTGPCEVDLRIEVEAEKVNSAIDETYKELSKRTKIPGFRPGKAPREIIERFVGEERVKDQAADKLIQPAYSEALKEAEIDPWAPADVELVEFELGKPLVFKAKVPLAPKVELGDYVGLTIERKLEPVTDEMVEDEIKGFLDRAAKLEQITDRPAMEGDTVVLDMKDESKPDAEPMRQVAAVGENLPDFDKGVTGMSVDEEKPIQITYPEDHQSEELRGVSKTFNVKIAEIHERKLPELNDEWVKENFSSETPEGEEPPADTVDTVDKLRARVRQAMEKSAANAADADVRDKLVDKLVANSQIDFPEVMVTERVRERLNETTEELKKRQLTLDDYLKHLGKNFEELRAEFGEDVKEALRANLVIYEVVEKESIKVEDSDVDDEVKSMAESRNVPVESVRAYLDSTDGLTNIRYRLLRKKVLDFLVAASNIKNVG
jgi:trigger factor